MQDLSTLHWCILTAPKSSRSKTDRGTDLAYWYVLGVDYGSASTSMNAQLC